MDALLALDPSSHEPLHRQVYDALRTAILTGRLRPGDRVPASRALADQLALSRSTVTEAYDQLQAEGYLVGRHGSGTYVAPTLPEDVLQVVARPSSPRSAAVPKLSAWGRRIVTQPYRDLIRRPDEETFRFDFRPHRVAEDSFPWDAWNAAVQRAIEGSRQQMLSYPPAEGHPELRAAIAEHVGRYRAVVCRPEQVVIVNGSQQGVNLLGELLLDAGDRVAVEDPGYPKARLAFEARGARMVRVPVDREGMMVDALTDERDIRLIHVTPSHQEPTGATLSLSRRLALLEIAERLGCLVLEDDYDSEFRYEGRPVESLQGLDRNGLVIYAGTFSKSVLAGLRLGFLILPPALLEPLVAAKTLWDSGAPILEQAALAAFLRSGDYERHIRRMRRLYRARRDALVAALRTHFGDRAIIGECHGGLNVLVQLDLPLSEADVLRRAAAAGIGLRGASNFYLQPPSRPTLLLGLAAQSEADIEVGIESFAACLQLRRPA